MTLTFIKRPAHPIKALIFDVGDILYDASAWRRWLAVELSATLGRNFTYSNLVEKWESFLIPVYKGKMDYWSAFQGMLAELRVDSDQSAKIEANARLKGKSVQLERRPMPGVRETLAALQGLNINLVALSDNESGESGVRDTLAQLGIEQYFDAVVSSCSIGHVKPEPQAFDYAIEKTRFPKRHCGFVAHDVDELKGAMDHGLFAVGYNFHPDAPADALIEHFDELIQLVNSVAA